MELEHITPSLVESALKSVQQQATFPQELLELDLLLFLPGEPSGSDVEREMAASRFLAERVVSELRRLRTAEKRQPEFSAHSRTEMIAELKKDFLAGNPQLEGYSFLYHRYLSPIPLTVDQLVDLVPMGARNLRRRLALALDLLVDLLRRQEMQAHRQQRVRRLARFIPPPDYHRLFGIDDPLGWLRDWWREASRPLVSVEGLGGLGKTALVRAFVNELSAEADLAGICWVSARQEGPGWPAGDKSGQTEKPLRDQIVSDLVRQAGLNQLAGLDTAAKLSGLTQLLEQHSFLLVVDNLETEQETADLLPVLVQLAGRARIILTSRHTVSDFPAVARFVVPALGSGDCRLLVESELARRGRPMELTGEQLDRLLAVTGGIPLALKLAAAQLSQLPFEHVLGQLRHAQGKLPEEMYRRIYFQSWNLLEKPARQLLVSMLPIPPGGESLSWLHMMSELEAGPFEEALAQLLNYSLIEVGGALDQPLYGLHRLTATFLQTDILARWQ